MRETILYIAMSLDGYIADAQGGVGWLAGHDEEAGDSGSYDAFVQTVDTVVMGWNTYHQVITELSPSAWPYEGLTCYVITHRTEEAQPMESVIFTDKDPCELVRRLRREPGRSLWICGGASIVQQLVRGAAIDRYRVSIIPVILGGGVRLFGDTAARERLCLMSTSSENGIVELEYTKRQANRVEPPVVVP